jgi:uncharacterized membrane protein
VPTSHPPTTDDSAVEATINIERPVDEVFAFYRDFTNLPRYLGDVMAVEPINRTTSRWTIQGPLGLRAHWIAVVTQERLNEVICYEITGTGTSWTICFAAGPRVGSTHLREILRTPFGKMGRVALALLGKDPAQEVPANLGRLKQLMETGRVTDKVAGDA